MPRLSRIAMLLFTCLIATSCAKSVALTEADRQVLVVPGEVGVLAGLKPVLHGGREYLFLKLSRGGEQVWSYGATLLTPGAGKVIYNCGFSVLSTRERAQVMLNGSGAVEKITPAENRLQGLAGLYGADQVSGVQYPDELSLRILKGRVFYHWEVQGQAVREADVRGVLIRKIQAVEERFGGTP